MVRVLFILLFVTTEKSVNSDYIDDEVWRSPNLKDYATCKDNLIPRIEKLNIFNIKKRLKSMKPEFSDVISLQSVEKRVFRDAHLMRLKLWPNGRIPVILERGMSRYHQERIACAFLYFQEKTCVHFDKWNMADQTAVMITKNDIRGGCFSETLGKKETGIQIVNLDDNFSHCWKHGAIVHELLHVVGLFHEQSRQDRDKYVKIQWDNIPFNWKQQYYKGNELGIKLFDVGEYDYGSVLHYNRFLLDDPRRPAISARKSPISKNNRKMGNRVEPTDKDTDKVNILYCKATTTTTSTSTTTTATMPSTTQKRLRNLITRRRFVSKGKEPSDKDLCNQPKEAGDFCLPGWITRYFYDSENGYCTAFWFAGCNPNGNNFKTISQCERKCVNIPMCEMNVSQGRWCNRGYKERYYFDKRSTSCKIFWYAGCDGNANNFESERSCMLRCGRIIRSQEVLQPRRCFRPRQFGRPCLKPWSRRYYFDALKSKCKFFWYQGCGGNDNNFQTLASCRDVCKL